MTLDDIKAYPKETITADMAGAVLGFSGHAIRLAARDFPERLGFPVVQIGHRTRIPKRPFIHFMETPGAVWFKTNVAENH